MARMMKAKTTEFRLYAPQARKVTVAGSFNSWNTKTLSAKRDSQGNWIVKANLKPGRYEYKFFVDGSWLNDPRCTWLASNNFGSQNCVIEIK